MRNSMFLFVLALAVVSAAACAHGDKRNDVGQETEIASNPRSLETEEPSTPMRKTSESEPSLETLTEEELHAALDQALAAAIAASVGDSPCERSYNSMVAMRDSLVDSLGEEAAQDLPSRERFIQACEQLPQDAQRCMDIAYAMDNHEECQRVMEAVPHERRRAMEELLQEE